MMSKKQIRLWLWSASILAVFNILTKINDQSLTGIVVQLLLKTGINLIIIFILILLYNIFYKKYFRKFKSKRITKSTYSSSRIMLIFFLLLVLFWIPAFLALFPGTFGADAPIQLAMYDGIYPLSDHQPILHTFLIGGLIHLGDVLFKNSNIGLAIYTFVFQICFCAYSISYSLSYLYKRQVSLKLLLLLIIFMGVNPIVQSLICYVTKDIMFAATFLLFIVNCCEYLFPSDRLRRNKRFLKITLIKIGLFGFLSIQLRSQGIYIFIVALLILLICWCRLFKENALYKEFIFMQIFVIGISMLITMITPYFLNSGYRDSREALSVPIQQIATILKKDLERDNKLLSSNIYDQAISYFENFDKDRIDQYSADYPKSMFLTDKVKENPIGFLNLYIYLVFSDLPTSVNSYLDLITPYFDFRLSPYNGLAINTSFEDLNPNRNIKTYSLFPGYYQYLKDVLYDSSSLNCPFWIRIFDPAIVLYLIIFMLIYSLIYKRTFSLFVLLYPILYIGTMFLGPVSLLRYSFVYSLEGPFLLGVMIYSINNQRFKNRLPIK